MWFFFFRVQMVPQLMSLFTPFQISSSSPGVGGQSLVYPWVQVGHRQSQLEIIRRMCWTADLCLGLASWSIWSEFHG